jgi:hypothetical protein
VAAVLAAGVATGSVLASPASHAAAAVAGPGIYVDNSPAVTCSDTSSASGTESTPFCTISAAAAVAQPGQTVYVAAGTYAPVTVSASGTASAPITFEGGFNGSATIDPTSGQNAFLISGAHDVVINGFNTRPVDTPAYEVTGGSSGITINGGQSQPNPLNLPAPASSAPATPSASPSPSPSATGSATPNFVPGVEVDSASGVTVSRGSFLAENIEVNSGASAVDIADNTIVASQDHAAVAITGAPGTDVAGNTVLAVCGPGISLSSGSTGASVENNVVSTEYDPAALGACTTAGDTTAITVAADSTTSTVSNYNLIDTTHGGPLYNWGGTSYSSLIPFQTATSQGAKDLAQALNLTANPNSVYTPGVGTSQWIPPTSIPAVIDSANADAPGELATDELGNPRADDPNVANTGAGSVTYFDRGAVEAEGGVALGVNIVPSGSLTVTATSKMSSFWTTNGPIGISTYTFGDPWPVVTTATSIQHAYQTTGPKVIDFGQTYGGHGVSAMGSTTVSVGAGYTPVMPTRILDTRNGTGLPANAVPANGTITLPIPTTDGVPATSMTAVVMNVTVTQPKASGTLTVYPGSGTAPGTSNLNFTAGETVPNLVTVPVTNGEVSFHNAGNGTVQVVADLEGFYGAGGSGFGALVPVRVLDTRNGTGATKAPLGSDKVLQLNLSGKVPSGTTAVALNVTVTGTQKAGVLTVYPGSATVPTASNLNFSAGETVPNMVIVPLYNGIADIYNGSGGTVNVVADLEGTYGTSPQSYYAPVTPIRLLDTRQSSPVPAHGTIWVTVNPKSGGYPVSGVFNVTVTGPKASGFLTASTGPSSSSSNVNFSKGETVPNLVLEVTNGGATADDSMFSITNNSGGTTQVIVDEEGYFIP